MFNNFNFIFITKKKTNYDNGTTNKHFGIVFDVRNYTI